MKTCDGYPTILLAIGLTLATTTALPAQSGAQDAAARPDHGRRCEAEETPWTLAAYVVAMMCHFLAIDHALREEHGAAFDWTGRFVLAGTCVLGWGAGLLFAVPPFVLALLLAFVSGAVIMNSAIMELPSEKDGRFWPFVMGGLAYRCCCCR